LTDELDQWEIQQLLCQPDDIRHVRLSIKAKTEDAGDWAGMLLQMYAQWAIRQNYKINVIEQIQDSLGGIRSVTLEINGWNAYGYLKMEDGVHCLRKLSPFKRKGKFENSLVSVQVVPIVDDVTIAVPSEHWETITFRVDPRTVNKTVLGVRVTHIPTGLCIHMTEERSIVSATEKAIVVLTNQLFWIMTKHQIQDLSQIRGSMLAIDWHHPIRQYRFDTTPLVIDCRSGYRSHAMQALLAGEMDDLLTFGIRANSTDRPNQLDN
jgi:peptide chain release factor 2